MLSKKHTGYSISVVSAFKNSSLLFGYLIKTGTIFISNFLQFKIQKQVCQSLKSWESFRIDDVAAVEMLRKRLWDEQVIQMLL